MEASKNLSNKQVRNAKKLLKFVKKESKLNARSIAKTDKPIEEIIDKNKAREEESKNIDEILKKYNTKKHKGCLKK